MSTLELSPSGVPRPQQSVAGAARRSGRAPIALGTGLLALTVYAVFAHGAIQSPAEPRLQVATAAIAAVAAGACLWMGTLRFAAPRVALAAVALLIGFAMWSALTLAWSVAPDLTWIEFNRLVAYLLILGLAIVLGASAPRALPLVTAGFFGLILAVTAYAIGQKVLPGIHVGSLLDLDQTGRIARLQEPLGYWNALALLLAMGAPAALALAAKPDGQRRTRLLGLVTLQLLLIAGGFTFSRGGVVALVVGLATFVALSGGPLRILMWLAAAAVAATPPLVAGLASHSLSAGGVSLGRRESAGLLLLLIVVSCAVVLVLGADRLLELERTRTLEPETRRRLIRAMVGAVGGAAVLLLAAVALSSRGLPGTVSHLWSSFTAAHGISTSDPTRLLSADSANRWVWWKEAAGAFSARPLGGWGAGSFPVVHLLFRHDTLPVNQPHSAVMQWLAETGLIGAGLAVAGWGLLLTTGLRAVRRPAAAPDRLFAAALFAGAVAYSVHALYDWDWDFPGVTVPALVLLGVLAGSLRGPGRGRPGEERAGGRRVGGGMTPGVRILALGATTLGLCAVALSSVIPSIAATKASAALVAAASGSAPALQHAQDQAALASRLDPLSDAGLRAEASIALQRGQSLLARAYLIEAVSRNPSDENAWNSLAFIDSRLHRYRDALAAAQRAWELDPHGALGVALGVGLTQQANVMLAPPTDDPTATPTPAPPATPPGGGP
jgi:hypothetical protein